MLCGVVQKEHIIALLKELVMNREDALNNKVFWHQLFEMCDLGDPKIDLSRYRGGHYHTPGIPTAVDFYLNIKVGETLNLDIRSDNGVFFGHGSISSMSASIQIRDQEKVTDMVNDIINCLLDSSSSLSLL